MIIIDLEKEERIQIKKELLLNLMRQTNTCRLPPERLVHAEDREAF
jgi:hypothetical protein